MKNLYTVLVMGLDARFGVRLSDYGPPKDGSPGPDSSKSAMNISGPVRRYADPHDRETPLAGADSDGQQRPSASSIREEVGVLI